MTDQIYPFKVQFSKDEIDDFLQRAKEIVTTGALIPGKNNTELEKLFASFINTKYAIAVSTGTIALEIIFRMLDLKDTEVLVPANTNYATAEAAISAGAKVILYDSDLYPDFTRIQALTTKNTKALVLVHIGGYITPEIEQIIDFCKKNNIYLVEDASHAHGSAYKNQPAGSFGIASAFSMFATKVITTSEGGIIVTNKSQFVDLAKTYRDQGKDKEGIRNIVFGSSWRMSELHAALGIAQMKHAKNYLQRNNEIIAKYNKNIIPTRFDIPFDVHSMYSGYKYILLCKNNKDRESLSKYLVDHGIKPGKNVYDVPLHKQPAFSFSADLTYPKAEAFAQNHVCLPIWKGMTDTEVDTVINVVNSWSEKNG